MNSAIGTAFGGNPASPELEARRELPLLRFGCFELDRERRELRKSGELVRIQTKPLALLVYLIENAGRMVSHEEILRAVWPNVRVEPGVMKSAVHALRRALGSSEREGGSLHEGFWIKSVHGQGYRFVAELRQVERAAASTSHGLAAEAPPRLKVLVCDDHALFREGLRFVLSQLQADLVWIEAPSGDEVAALLERHSDVDLVLLDLALPGIAGLDVLEMLRRVFPAVPVVVVSASEHPADLRSALEGGASGYISKATSGPVLRAAVQLVLAGGIYVPPALIGRCAPEPPAGRPAAERRAAPSPLTGRQREVAALMSRGLTNPEIAHVLGIAEGTVKAQLVSRPGQRATPAVER